MNGNFFSPDLSGRPLAELVPRENLLRPDEDLTGAMNRLARESRVAGSETWTGIENLLNDLKAYHLPTYDHCLRVGIYTHSVAVNWEGCDDPAFAFMAGVAHDIGKRKIPLRILNANGSLSEHDRLIMKRHTFLGFDVLKGIDLPVAAIAGLHHKFPPEGFRRDPYGIDMEMISPKLSQAIEDRVIAMAKLVMLIDNFDARMIRDDRHTRFESDSERLQAVENDFHEDDARLQWLFDHRIARRAETGLWLPAGY